MLNKKKIVSIISAIVVCLLCKYISHHFMNDLFNRLAVLLPGAILVYTFLERKKDEEKNYEK